MEKQTKIQSSSVRYAFIKLAMVCLLAANSFGILQAQSPSKSPAAEIKYIGTIDNKIFFEVEYKNDLETGFMLEIRDKDGYNFYSARFRQKNFRKKYAIDKGELGHGSITFVLAAKGMIHQQEFDVNSSTRVVEEVSVVKL